MKNKLGLSRALGLTQGCLHIKDMEEFDKNALISTLEEVEQILTEIIEENDE